VSSRLSRPWVLFAALALVGARALGASTSGPVPAGVILVKGAWSSAAGTATPLPEGGAVSDGKYGNAYFGLEYAFGADWTQRYEGPPPSESGYYVLAQIEQRNPARSSGQNHVLIAAQDLFFTLNPAHDALELIHYYQEHLGADYRVQRPPTKVRVANRDFVRFDYLSPAAGLQWHVLATEIRCHVVLFTFAGSDAQITRRLIDSMGTMPQTPGSAPICLKDYASAETVIEREDPVFSAARFNPVPVRIVIDAQGTVKHIHFLSAFPDQAKSIADALSQWQFKPLIVGGQPVEVETGLMFGRPPRPSTSALH
jgi:hypothetical protein